MEFDNRLEVPLPIAETWKLLLDIKRIATCIPGAELTEVVDENTYKGKVAVRFGPVALSLGGQAQIVEINHQEYKARVKARGADAKGRGTAESVIDFRLEPAAGGTLVAIHTKVNLAGAIAQYGRGSGMIHSFASQLIADFGQCLKTQLAMNEGPRHSEISPPAAASAMPVSGFAWIARGVWSWFAGLFKRQARKS